ncbi:MAG TPA: hypothetical protein VNW23_07100 [Opitutaceae bacterium]|nr:hypothetical protein [Opitutaceae bacterium]
MRLLTHRFALGFISALFCLAPARAGDVTFVRIWPGYSTAGSFERISEYFTGQENTGGRTVLRSQPANRAGFYFLMRLENSGTAVAGAIFELSVVSPVSATPKLFTFATDLPAGKHVFDCGLTGTDWPDAAAHPVAWKLVVRAPGGAEIASTQSFMWSKPDTGAKAPK